MGHLTHAPQHGAEGDLACPPEWFEVLVGHVDEEHSSPSAASPRRWPRCLNGRLDIDRDLLVDLLTKLFLQAGVAFRKVAAARSAT